jgi:hypothetical protein
MFRENLTIRNAKLTLSLVINLIGFVLVFILWAISEESYQNYKNGAVSCQLTDVRREREMC